jgi:DNA-binding transcriptional regulator YiaG
MASVGRQMVERLKRFAEALEETDSIPKRFTCRTVKLNLEPTPYDPERVKKAREALAASQVIFAQFLGVSPSAVRDWEQGAKPPRGSACRIMDEILRDPKYWRARLLELATPVTAD